MKEDLKANRSLVRIYYIVDMFWLVNTESKDQMACCAFLSGRCVSTPGTLLLVSTTAMQASLTTCDLWCESLICQTWTAPPLAMAWQTWTCSIWAKVHTDLPGQTGAAFAFAVHDRQWLSKSELHSHWIIRNHSITLSLLRYIPAPPGGDAEEVLQSLPLSLKNYQQDITFIFIYYKRIK